MFGQNSNCLIARVTDGMSNTFMLAETCFQVRTGTACQAWGYRAWIMAGIDPQLGINQWEIGEYGTLATSGTAASMHPGGCLFAMGDGSVRRVSQSVDTGTLYFMSTIADGVMADTE